VGAGLPKTRSGKIMRRICARSPRRVRRLGDISTLADPSVVQHLIDTHKTMNVA
jgi:acetyl-CoA synthetase